MSYKVVSQGDTLIMKGEILPSPRLQVQDSTGEVVVATAVLLELFDPAGTQISKAGVETDDVWEFTWVTPETDTETRYRTLLRATADPVIPSLYGPSYVVYDPALLWADPSDVIAIVGDDFTQTQVVEAILFAQSVVGAWVTVPVQSPVPDPIRQATTLLAARALTTVSGATTSDGRIISETIADYTVRYADPMDDGGGVSSLPADIAALLAPYHARVGQTKIGPATPWTPLPITLDPAYAGWIEDEDEDL